MADPFDISVDMTVVSSGPDPDGGYRHVLRNVPGSTLAGQPIEVDYIHPEPLAVGSRLQLKFDSRYFKGDAAGATEVG